jgi:Holliday junction DNA helicase RuvA
MKALAGINSQSPEDKNTVLARLSGTLLEKSSGVALIDVGGVTFEILISVNTFDRLPTPNEAATVWTQLIVREDSLTLCGFHDKAEKEAFGKLLSVAGIGVKSALSTLSGFTPRELAAAIQAGDIKRISSVPGIGKKTAERLIVELRDKMPPAGSHPGGELEKSSPKNPPDVLREDLVSALVNFGWPVAAAEKTVTQVLEEESSRELSYLLKQAMKRLYR